ncbi:hypothetical protein [Hymenobacter arizonensis]|uniref:Uncharacterized protein n=1 Tax=Hymenobacter arizonensis TaxID=1227077 RepID=A0A1I6BN96_HYMAR|nr:hypothetical protein [Hymenobacter arizonensis]SFQ82391.1 hypothetical protein SAMN04515668_4800 [Hymenobacter arizonensis]
MPTPTPHEDTPEVLALAETFRQAGAANPETWARSQVHEGINQWARFHFLKTLSTAWLPENALDWVEAQRQAPSGDAQHAGAQLPKAVREMRAVGVRPEQILDLIRVIQFETLFHVCHTLDGATEATPPVQGWALFETDAQGMPLRPIEALHESLLEFDPSGRELRPRSG